MSAPLVELEEVFRWKCPACKAVNYEDPREVKLTPEELREYEGLDPDDFPEDAEWQTVPETVLCSTCLELCRVAVPLSDV